MPDRFLPHTPALSADSVRENARAKAVRASYEFWSTGNEVLLEQAFAETFAEHAARHRASLSRMACGQAAASGRRKRNQNDAPSKGSRRKSAPGSGTAEAALEWSQFSDPEMCRAIPSAAPMKNERRLGRAGRRR